MTTSHQGTLLVIDDTTDDVNLLLTLLTQAGFKVLIAQNGAEGIERAEYTRPDLILLDIKMLGMDGFEVCRRLKSQENTQNIPIIFMTVLADALDKITAFSLGAVDYITKPIQCQELLARVSAHVKLYQQQQSINRQNQELKQLIQKLQHLEEQLIERTIALEKANCELEHLNALDGLTQIANRRRFDEYLIYQWCFLAKKQLPLSLIFADIDYFKDYNDHYGHQAGDDCLRQVAKIIESVVKRSSDLVARYGGEEFVVLLPQINLQEAKSVAENIQTAIRHQIIHAYSTINDYVSLSIGIASIIPNSEFSPDFLVKQADKALYKAKQQGRNRIII